VLKTKVKGVLILTPFFPPNVGGVETYSEVLTSGLSKNGYTVYVHTYSPITTENVTWKRREERYKNVYVHRYAWLGWNLFHKLEQKPAIEFLYITPYLFVRTFLWLLVNSRKISTIHCFGLNSAFMGVIFKKLFKKRLIVTIHAVYERNPQSTFAKSTAYVLNKVDKALTLSDAASRELTTFGVHADRLARFHHWVNLDMFKPRDKNIIRKELGLEEKFTVLFVGRLLRKKGTHELCEAAINLKDVNFIFVGIGAEEQYLREMAAKYANIKFVGMIPNSEVYKYYNCADVFTIPSQYEEGYGRVIMEAVASGLPVVGANKGGIPEALDSTVSILVDPTAKNLEEAIKKLYTDRDLFMRMSLNCREYAKKNFSEENISLITKWYGI
jgi:glycosyltransferase involved in cell wall biosynthesis